MSGRPAAVAFDVIETLASLEPLRERLVDLGQPPDCSRPGTRGPSGTAWRWP